ncbi:MAG: histidine kinase N-terminal 7TM domain-containing protein [Anaerolineales bacterium]|jgi:PAS domain S-box-containing protein|nr:histidine kinase N-terminal 7TM domain-containing protein [Anaerolineales bacterium]
MQFEFSAYSLPLLAGALISLVVAVSAWRQRATPGAAALVLLSLLIAQWSVCYALEIAGTDLATKFFWGKLQYIGIPTVPFFWFVFAYNRAFPGKRLSHRWMLALALVPLTTVALAMTIESHKLIWVEVEIVRSGSLATLGIVARGWWFWVHFAYSYLLLAAGTYIFARSMRHLRGMYRGQMIVVVISVIAPWAGNILYFLGVNPDPTPFAFSITVAGFMWAIFGFRLVDVAPLARELIIDGMRDGMLVLDLGGRIADINSAAARMIGLPAREVLGKPAAEALAPWSDLLARFRDSLDVSDEIAVGRGEAERHYGVRISALSDPRGNLIGRLVTLRALDDSVPLPRAAIHEPATQPLLRDQILGPERPAPQPAPSNPVLNWLKNFFMPPVLSQVALSGDLNPIWAQTIERAITISARFVMVFGSIIAGNILVHLNWQVEAGYAVAILFFLAIVYFLALARRMSFTIRVRVFVFLVYMMALTEMLRQGFSTDVFIYFMVLVVLSHLLLDVRGGFVTLGFAITAMLVFAWAVLSGVFVPLSLAKTNGLVLPVSVAAATSNIVGYLFSALTMMTIINMFIVNLNQAWKKETQALNLVQQERDLLEDRVRRRTADLAEARDLAVQSSNELRKYFQAIEQSGNSIVITNPKGDIEYVNPHFELNTGYTLAEALGKNPRILKSGTQTAEYYAQMWRTLSEGRIWRGEIQNKRKNGSLFWEAATLAPVQNEDGVITNYVAIKEDISAQKELRQQLERQNEYLATLQSITLELLNRRNLDDLLNAVVERACALMDVSLGLIALRNPAGEYILRAATKAQAHTLGKPVMAARMKYTAQALETGQPVIVDNYGGLEPPYRVADGGYLQATADFPIIAGGEVVGVLALGRTRENYPFSGPQLETAPLFAQMVSLVLDNANLYDSAMKEIEQRKQAEERNLRFVEDMKSLQEIHIQLSQINESQQLYIQMIEFTQNRLGLDRVGLFLLDESRNALVGTYGVSPDGKLREESYYHEEITPGHWTVGLINAPNHTQLWEDAPILDNSEVVGSGWKVASTLWNGQKAIGFLVCDNLLSGRPPRTYEVELISLLGSTFGHLVERNRNEILLQESESRFRQIVETASDMIYRADSEGRFTYLNPIALKVIGAKNEAEILGRSYLEMVKPEWQARVRRFYVRQFLRGEHSTYFEFEGFTQDGREVWIGQNVQIIKDAEKMVGFQAVARDITKLKQAQEALALARDQALDASRFKSQLLAKVSHELRTPLGAVIGYAELLQNNLFGKLNEEQRDAADNIVDSANYLNTMIGELLDQAQIEARSVQLRIQPFSPSALIERVASTMQILAEKKGLDFTYSVAPDLPETLQGDSKRLQQILINLAGNAIKFTSQGSVKIEFLRSDRHHWAMRISDSGAGIPKAAQTYIFEPFRQVDNDITHYNRGTGLGLSITKQLAELMGGQIKLESEVGNGSTFTVILPFLAEE